MAGRTTTADGRADRTGDRDLVRQYLDELRAFPLLTAAEEVTLAKAIEAGRVAAAELDNPATPATPPTARQRRELNGAIDVGAAARARFIQSNLRLVVSVAKRYQSSGLSMLDLIQEGNLGLMRAVEKFDHRKGFKFSTYATWWIRQAITRAIADKSRTIRVPAHMGETLSVLSRVRPSSSRRSAANPGRPSWPRRAASPSSGSRRPPGPSPTSCHCPCRWATTVRPSSRTSSPTATPKRRGKRPPRRWSGRRCIRPWDGCPNGNGPCSRFASASPSTSR